MVQKAYYMCSGQPSALPNTHSTIVATLVIPKTGTGAVMVPSATKTADTAPRSTFVTSTTGLFPQPTTPGLFGPPESSVPGISGPTPSSQNGLGTPQIAGISVGIAVALLLAVAAILLAKYIRRKNMGDRASMARASFIRTPKPPPEKRFQGGAFDISAPIAVTGSPIDHKNPPWKGPTWRPDGIGLALTSPDKTGGFEPGSNKQQPGLLPAKPGPKLTIPPTPPQKDLIRREAQQDQRQGQDRPQQSQGEARPEEPQQPAAYDAYRPRYPEAYPPQIERRQPTGWGPQYPPQTKQADQDQYRPPAQAPYETSSRPQRLQASAEESPYYPGQPVWRPQQPATAYQQERQPFKSVQPTGRESIMTAFEEDSDAGDSGFTGPQGPSNQIDEPTSGVEPRRVWQPPLKNRQSAQMSYVADGGGNWVLASTLPPADRGRERSRSREPTRRRQPDDEPSPAISLKPVMGLPATPAVTVPTKPQQAFLGKSDNTSTQPSLTPSPSVYSQSDAPRRPQLQYGSQHEVVGWRPPRPPQKTAQSQRKMQKPKPLGRSDSSGSATSIASSIVDPYDEEDGTGTYEPALHSVLSPVVESPKSYISGISGDDRRSPVSYPRIPGRPNRISPPQQQQLTREPRIPNFADLPPVGSGSGPVSAAVDAPSSYQSYARPMLRTPPAPQPSPTPEGRNPASRTFDNLSGSDSPRPIPPLKVRPPHLRRPSDGNIGVTATGPSSGLQQQQQQQQQFGAVSVTQIVYQQPPFPSPEASAVANASGGSSLLAKRLGNDRAATLSLANSRNDSPARKPNKWVRQDANPPLPATPTWQPKLTPTKKGDDLYLSVQ